MSAGTNAITTAASLNKVDKTRPYEEDIQAIDSIATNAKRKASPVS